MDPLSILGIASTLYGIYNKYKGAEETEKYKDEQEAYQDKLKKESEKKERMAALQRAVGSKTQLMPTPDPDAPEEPDLSGYQTRAGIADLLAGIGAYGVSGGFDSKPKKIDMPYDDMFDNLKYNPYQSPIKR